MMTKDVQASGMNFMNLGHMKLILVRYMPLGKTSIASRGHSLLGTISDFSRRLFFQKGQRCYSVATTPDVEWRLSDVGLKRKSGKLSHGLK